jgi:hypothetical protein
MRRCRGDLPLSPTTFVILSPTFATFTPLHSTSLSSDDLTRNDLTRHHPTRRRLTRYHFPRLPQKHRYTPAFLATCTLLKSIDKPRSTATMGKAEVGSSKWVGNQMRSKGLQRLRASYSILSGMQSLTVPSGGASLVRNSAETPMGEY